MKIYKLEITEKMENNTVEGVIGYYSTKEKAKEEQKKQFKDFGVDVLTETNSRDYLNVKEAIEIEEIELDEKIF